MRQIYSFMGIMEHYNIDKIDKDIISLLQKNPNITHSEIARTIGRSQPAIGSRIHKLIEKGIISSQFGINFKNTKLFLSKLEISSREPDNIWKMSEVCPFIINCMKLSGERNLLLLIASSSLKIIDKIIDHHFRNREYITDINMEVISDFAHDFILPINFKMDEYDPLTGKGCMKCSFY